MIRDMSRQAASCSIRSSLIPLVMVVLLATAGAGLAEWNVYRAHPFVEATADELSGRLGLPLRSVDVRTLRNDFAHAAVGIKVGAGTEEAVVTVRLDANETVAEHVTLRVAGFVKQKDIGYSIDPVFTAPGELDLKLENHIRNLRNIHGFPTVKVTERDPVLVWLTVDTRGMAAGVYKGAVVFTGEDGTSHEAPLRIEVGDYELPLENPLYTWGWQYGHDWVNEYSEYGINVVHMNGDMAVAREAGYKFFAIRFNPAWKSSDPSEFDQEQAEQALETVRSTVEKLALQPDEWAIYMRDEPNDDCAAGQALWCEWVLVRWPEARFLFNPGWGPGPQNEWGSVEGTVKPLAPHADVWLPYSHWLWDAAAPESVELMRESADSVWYYEIMGSSYSRRPSVGRGLHRSLAWTAWRYDLQGACWYSLNAYANSMWSDNSSKEEYACVYGTIPGRGLEAVRQSIQEYKRLYEMRRLGVSEAETDAFCDRLFAADSVIELTRIRRQMDRRLLEAAGTL